MIKLKKEEGVQTTISQSFKRTSHTFYAKSIKSIGLPKLRASVAGTQGWKLLRGFHGSGFHSVEKGGNFKNDAKDDVENDTKDDVENDTKDQ